MITSGVLYNKNTKTNSNSLSSVDCHTSINISHLGLKVEARQRQAKQGPLLFGGTKQ